MTWIVTGIFEESKETYYETLEASSTGWHDGRHNASPWMDYFWEVLPCEYREFEDRGTIGLGKGSKTKQVRQIVDRRIGPFSISDIEADFIGVRRDMIRIVLRQLHDGASLRRKAWVEIPSGFGGRSSGCVNQRGSHLVLHTTGFHTGGLDWTRIPTIRP